MYKRLTIALAIGLLFVAACGAAPEATPSATETPPRPSPTPAPLTTPVTGVPAEEAYPGEMISPTFPPMEQDYPAPPPADVPLFDPYPAEGQVWIIHPQGQQCAEPVYADLEAAVTAMNEAGIGVHSAEEISLMVAAGCDFPTPTHYRLLIDTADLGPAQALNWVAE